MPLIKDQVDDGKYRLYPAAQLVSARRLKGHMSFRESLLGAKDPLSYRFLRYKKGPGDLRRSEAADQTQRKRDASFYREYRMACGKDQPQHVIVDHLIQRLVHRLSEPLLLHLKLPSNFFVLLYKHLPAAQTIDGTPLCRRHQPRSGIFGDTFFGPPLKGRNQRVLGKFFGNADIAGDAGNRSDEPRRLDLPHRLDRPVDIAHVRLILIVIRQTRYIMQHIAPDSIGGQQCEALDYYCPNLVSRIIFPPDDQSFHARPSSARSGLSPPLTCFLFV